MGDAIKSKVKKLFDKIIQYNIEISDANLIILSNYLTEVSIGDILEENDFITWLKKAVLHWKVSNEKYSMNVLLLISDVIGLRCSDEQVFLNLNFTRLLDDVFGIIRSIPEIEKTPLVQEYFIRLISAFLKHKSGTQWLIATNFWFDVLTLTLNTSNDKIFNAGCGFLVELVARTKCDNDIFCNNVIKMLLAPLHSFQKLTSHEEYSIIVDKENNNDKIVKQLALLEAFLSQMLFKCCLENEFKFISMLHERFLIDNLLENIITHITDDELHFQLNKILNLVYYFILAKELKQNSVSLEKTAKLNFYSAKVYEVIRDEAAIAEDYSKVLKLIHLDHIYFRSIVKDLACANVAIIEFQYQMFAFLMVPVEFVLIYKIGMKEFRDITNQGEFREQFTNKIIRKLLPLTFRTLTRMHYSPKRSRIQDALAAFQHIRECCRFYDPSVIHTIAEAMVHIFSDIIEFLYLKNVTIEYIPQDFMIAILDTCIYLFGELDLTWKDIFETIFLTEIVGKCVGLACLSTKVMVKSLQFWALSIRKNFHTNLALLLSDVDEDDHVIEFERCMRSKLEHSNWEIRNESLNVIRVGIQKHIEFGSPKTKGLLFQNHYPSLLLKMAKTDSVLTVRISAMQGLRDFVKVNEYWEYLQRQEDFQDQVMQMYYLEPNGILRGEAIALITSIYLNQELSGSFLEKLYDSMTYAVIQDEFTIVKTNALIFWKKVIEQHLKNEGVIDGEFPEATFSIEFKKIITFDQFQIRKCLYKVLCKLSRIGCITAFLYALNCNSNEELVKVALDLINPFLLLCKKHFYTPALTEAQHCLIIPCPRTKSTSSETLTAICSPYSPAPSLSPYPESLYDDILDLQESLNTDLTSVQSLFEDMETENAGVVQRNEFLRFAGEFDVSVYNTPKEDRADVEGVINTILNS